MTPFLKAVRGRRGSFQGVLPFGGSWCQPGAQLGGSKHPTPPGPVHCSLDGWRTPNFPWCLPAQLPSPRHIVCPSPADPCKGSLSPWPLGSYLIPSTQGLLPCLSAGHGTRAEGVRAEISESAWARPGRGAAHRALLPPGLPSEKLALGCPSNPSV